MIEENDEIIFFKDLYAGRLVDLQILKDGNAQISNYLIILEKTNNKIGIVGNYPYYLYKEISSSDSFYINNQGKVIEINKDNDVIESKIEIIHFLAVKKILNLGLDLLENYKKLFDFNVDEFDDLERLYNFALKYNDEDNFTEVNIELINDLNLYLESFHYLLFQDTQSIVTDIYIDRLNQLNHRVEKVLKPDTSKDKSHLELINCEDSRKLT